MEKAGRECGMISTRKKIEKILDDEIGSDLVNGYFESIRYKVANEEEQMSKAKKIYAEDKDRIVTAIEQLIEEKFNLFLENLPKSIWAEKIRADERKIQGKNETETL